MDLFGTTALGPPYLHSTPAIALIEDLHLIDASTPPITVIVNWAELEK